jgi:hypothetical protein
MSALLTFAAASLQETASKTAAPRKSSAPGTPQEGATAFLEKREPVWQGS